MTLVEAIKKAAVFAAGSSTLANPWENLVLSHGEVRAQDGIQGTLIKVDGMPGFDLAVNAKRALKVLQAVGDNPVFEVKDTQLQVTGARGTAKLPWFGTKDMPVFHRPTKAKWNRVEGLGRGADLAWCTSADAGRQHLSGINLRQGVIEATDGHALGTWKITSASPIEGNHIVPVGMFEELPDPTYVAIEGGRIYFADAEGAPDGFRVAALKGATFPPTEHVIPKDYPSAEADRDELIALLKSIKLTDCDAVLSVAGGRLTVNSSDKADALFLFEAAVDLRESTIKSGQEGFAAALLLALLQTCPEKTVKLYMDLNSKDYSLNPMMVTSGDYLAVIMPFRM
jgi:DNA polymerase III sliding clamp (beta) subunit (PCNA family)